MSKTGWRFWTACLILATVVACAPALMRASAVHAFGQDAGSPTAASDQAAASNEAASSDQSMSSGKKKAKAKKEKKEKTRKDAAPQQ